MLEDVWQEHETIWLVSILHQDLSAEEYKSLSIWYDIQRFLNSPIKDTPLYWLNWP